MTKATGAARRGTELVHHIKLHLHHRHKNHLRQPCARFDFKSFTTAVPAGNHDLALIVRVDQADQVTEHDAVLVTQTGARQDHCREFRIGNVYSHAGRHQHGLTGCHLQRHIHTGTQIDAGGTRRCVLRQGKIATQPRI